MRVKEHKISIFNGHAEEICGTTKLPFTLLPNLPPSHPPPSPLREHSSVAIYNATGLTWSQDRNQLASGGNDNLCCIWDAAAAATPRLTLKESQGGVKVRNFQSYLLILHPLL